MRFMRDFVQFKKIVRTSDGMGGYSIEAAPVGKPFRCQFIPKRGREIVENERPQAVGMATLRCRYNKLIDLQISEEDIAEIEGVEYQIRSITKPDRRQRGFEMVIERGKVAHG